MLAIVLVLLNRNGKIEGRNNPSLSRCRRRFRSRSLMPRWWPSRIRLRFSLNAQSYFADECTPVCGKSNIFDRSRMPPARWKWSLTRRTAQEHSGARPKGKDRPDKLLSSL